MKNGERLLWLAVGLGLGGVGVGLYLGPSRPVQAANDRYDDYVMATGSVAVVKNAKTDGVWLLDYRGGKLLGTVVDRNAGGKVVGWAEVDLVNEFGIPPRQNVHFLMTTGQISQDQAALYLAETTSGKFGVYTMGPRPDNQPGVAIRRHDLVTFRPAKDEKEKEK